MVEKRSHNFYDRVGQKYGDMTVLKFLETRVTEGGSYKAMWLCECICGKQIAVSSGNLSSGNTTNCGCKRAERLQVYVDTILRLPKGEAAFNTVYAKYEFGAKKRGLIFDLSKEIFKLLCLGNCDYCGIAPSNTEADYGRKNGKFIYNGIDRIDNAIGYVKENCVTCCKICNYMKRTMGREAFLKHIEAIYHKSIGDKKCLKAN